MQLLTRGYYKATVHRVTAYDRHTCCFPEGDGSAPSRRQALQNRISCPLIVRGRHPTEVKPLSMYARYPCRSLPLDLKCNTPHVLPDAPPCEVETTNEEIGTSPCHERATNIEVAPGPHNGACAGNFIVDLPDLEESSMKVIHKLLDLKRRKCTKDNTGNVDGQDEPDRDWVLSAFPVTLYDV